MPRWILQVTLAWLYVVSVTDFHVDGECQDDTAKYSNSHTCTETLKRTDAQKLTRPRQVWKNGRFRRVLALQEEHGDHNCFLNLSDNSSSAVSPERPTHPDLGLNHLFQPLNRSCHPHCSKRGNCNSEEGQCECPFGYTGPTCEEALLSSCQLGPLQPPFFGMLVPRNCECVKQARNFFGCNPDPKACTLMSLDFHDARCYTFTGRPASEQWSTMPVLASAGVEFFEGPMALNAQMNPIPAVKGTVGFDIWGRNYLSLPLERCGPTQCHSRGACLVPLSSAEPAAVLAAAEKGEPHCECYKGYLGHTCGEELPSLCLNGCRNRGKCDRGFCHCEAPYWGLDCGRSRAWQPVPGATVVPNRQVLRIYVYELPANVAFPVALDDNVWDINEQFYQTHRKFTELLLQDTAVRTENPHEANLFFVPLNAYAYSSNTNPPTNQIAAALRYVSVKYPYFNASGGRDHFIWTTGDRGICYVPEVFSNVIHVTLFGLHANLRDNLTTFLLPAPTHHHNYGCYHPKKDVVAAPLYDTAQGCDKAPELYDRLVAAEGHDPRRDLLFFFAGSVRPGNPSYSGGARQALQAHLKQLLGAANATAGGGANNANYSDILFVEGFVPDYAELYHRSKFCLAPHGGGFGVRLTLAMTHGCVPVIIQDQVYQPYESDGVLPYSEFSLRLSKSDIPYIVPILRSVSPARLRHMRLVMAKYYRAFLWDPALGGRAYNYTIRVLKHRLHGLWGRLWGEPGHTATATGRFRDRNRQSLHRRHHIRR